MRAVALASTPGGSSGRRGWSPPPCVTPTPGTTITRPYAEYTLAAVFLRTRAATNERFRLTRVQFSHSRPADIREHERIFDCPVRFGANTCQLLIAREVWDTPRAGTDPLARS